MTDGSRRVACGWRFILAMGIGFLQEKPLKKKTPEVLKTSGVLSKIFSAFLCVLRV